MDSTTTHTVTSDYGYVDIISGKFDSTDQPRSLIRPSKTFEFMFTKAGEYTYHCEPHSHMQGKVEIVENFSQPMPQNNYLPSHWIEYLEHEMEFQSKNYCTSFGSSMMHPVPLQTHSTRNAEREFCITAFFEHRICKI